MFEHRFKAELMRLPYFEIRGERDDRVWKAPFPAWRAIFTALCLTGHSSGYQLPSYAQFFAACERVYCDLHRNGDQFTKYFRGELREGTKHRTSVWYQAGMAETYLYVCLVEAIEDRTKSGFVVYDPRLDWKFKSDAIVIRQDAVFRINAFSGDEGQRSTVERRRDSVERQRKADTPVSSRWGHRLFQSVASLRISMSPNNAQLVNGVMLFSVDSINDLLLQIYPRDHDFEPYFF